MKGEYDLGLTLELALLQAQLLVVDRSADVLSELGDLKEQRRLGEQSDKLILELSRQQLVPEDPLAFLRERGIAWLRDAGKLIKSATDFLEKKTPYAGKNPQNGYVSLDALTKLKARLEKYPAAFGKKLDLLRQTCVPELFSTGQQQETIGTIWSHLKHLGLEAPLVGNPGEILSAMILEPGEPDVLTEQLGADIAARLSDVVEHIGLAEAQSTDLSQALDDITRGDYKAAETLLRKPRKKRYANPNYDELKAAVDNRNSLLKQINSESSNALRLEIINTAMQKLRADEWPDSSPLKKVLLDAREESLKAAKAKKRKTVLGFMVFVALLVVLIPIIHNQEKEWRAEQARKAEEVRLEAERKAEEVRSWLASAEGKDLAVDVAGVPLVVKWIAPGNFLMGSPSSEQGRYSDEGPQTRVTISKGFWLGKYEVTQAQWKALMGSNPSNFKGEDRPVENVSWNDAMEFCRRFTERERKAGRLPVGMAYTLPTEAQWEYACRARTTTALNSGTNLTSIYGSCRNLDALGWHGKFSGGSTQPVGEKAPNAWGLYDMHGNVWEWCLDWKADYLGGSVTDPRGPASGYRRVYRGGSWSNHARNCRSADRDYSIVAAARDGNRGFRLSLSRVP